MGTQPHGADAVEAHPGQKPYSEPSIQVRVVGARQGRKPYSKPAISIRIGRPFRVLDLRLVARLAALGCTDQEIADALGITRQTLSTRKRDEPDLLDALKRGRSEVKLSLRRAQLKAISKGNTTMLIWLGKQMLQQRNHPEPIEEDDEALGELVLGRAGDAGAVHVHPGASLEDIRRAQGFTTEPGDASPAQPEPEPDVADPAS